MNKLQYWLIWLMHYFKLTFNGILNIGILLCFIAAILLCYGSLMHHSWMIFLRFFITAFICSIYLLFKDL